MAHHLKFRADAVAAVHVARHPGDIERLAAIVALDQADRLGDQLARLKPPPDPKRRLQAECDLGDHVGKFKLDQLVRGERPAELFAVERIAARRRIAGLGRTHRPPANAVTRAIEAAERTRQPRNIGQ